MRARETKSLFVYDEFNKVMCDDEWVHRIVSATEKCILVCLLNECVIVVSMGPRNYMGNGSDVHIP